MVKKYFLAIILSFTITALLGGLLAYKINKNHRQAGLAAKNAKAEEEIITIIEGWTINDIAGYLEDQKLIKKTDFISLQKAFDVSKYPLAASKPAQNGLEGFLFPDTYRIYKPEKNFDMNTGKEIINKMLDNFSNKFTLVMQAQATAKNMSVFEIITLASIVEKETGRNAVTEIQKTQLDEERRIIAGIFYNRLNANMPLESDATINFITKKNDPAPSVEDLNINSPYNTYKNKGLPPGPICNPSLSSIKAALEPAKTDYFYFLHDQKTGQAIYSKTFEEHVRNKFKYLK